MPSELKVILDEINYEFDILNDYKNHFISIINEYRDNIKNNYITNLNNADNLQKSLDYINMYNMHVTNLLIYLRALRDKLNDPT